MPKDWLEGIDSEYDVVVIGSGLGGLTGANSLAKIGYKVLLLEHHYQLGGLATWFKRPGGHSFDISLHGFPVGMIKSCRKYWSREIADDIFQITDIRFINPSYNIQSSYDKDDFTQILTTRFGVKLETLARFWERLSSMNFYDDATLTTQELFDSFFPGKTDVHRFLLEPISYANGSTLEDPAVTFAIVFGNFMQKGIYTFKDGTEKLIQKMAQILRLNGVDVRKRVLVEKVLIQNGKVAGVVANGREIKAKAVLSNANIRNTIEKLVGPEQFEDAYRKEALSVRLNNSSCQVYLGLAAGESIPEVGDLVFTSKSNEFSTDELTALDTTSRTFSIYYPKNKPSVPNSHYAIVSSTNARWKDWAELDDQRYEAEKEKLIRETIDALEEYLPGIRNKIDHTEAATPRTINHYTRHQMGTSFGTKYEGLKVSMDLPDQIAGLYHAGSVGIIMSGWLGTVNYGVIVANKMDQFLRSQFAS